MTNFFQLLILTPNLLKSHISYIEGGGALAGDKLFPTFNADSKSANIPNSLYGRGRGIGNWGGGAGDELFPTFDADFKSAKIPNSLYGGGWEVGRGGGETFGC